MTLDTLIMFFGAFVALLPFLGFPIQWDTVLLLLSGVIIIGLGVAVRRRGLSTPQKKNTTYVEHAPQETHEAQ